MDRKKKAFTQRIAPTSFPRSKPAHQATILPWRVSISIFAVCRRQRQRGCWQSNANFSLISGVLGPDAGRGHEIDFVQASSVPARWDPLRSLVVFSVYAQHSDLEELLAQRSIEASREAVLGEQARLAVRGQLAPTKVTADGPMAPRRNGCYPEKTVFTARIARPPRHRGPRRIQKCATITPAWLALRHPCGRFYSPGANRSPML